VNKENAMLFYMLKRKPRRDSKIPLETTDAHPGCVIVNCAACGTRGIEPHSTCGRIPVELLVRDAAYVDDIEQASTTLLFSRTFRDAVTAAGLTGIEFYDPVGYKLKRDTPKFQEVLRQIREEFQFQVGHVTGSGGSIARSSSVRLCESCDVCGWRAWTLPEKGFHIDPAQWDGADFFRVLEYAPFFMSERAVQVLQAAKLSNFGAIPADEFRLPPNYRQPPVAPLTSDAPRG
jgi:hypothetical protein